MFPRLATVLTAAVLLTAPAFAGSLQDARAAVTGAEADLSDARSYLADLKAGDFAGIYGVAEDGSLRCGEAEANPACAPLTEADKAQAIAEAEIMVQGALAELADAKVEFAALGGEGVRTASGQAGSRLHAALYEP